MIVAIASGSSKNFTLDIRESMQTMTGYIVEFTSGDAGSGTLGYYSLYAVGLLLFLFTLGLNMAAQAISRKYREVYHRTSTTSNTPRAQAHTPQAAGAGLVQAPGGVRPARPR